MPRTIQQLATVNLVFTVLLKLSVELELWAVHTGHFI